MLLRIVVRVLTISIIAVLMNTISAGANDVAIETMQKLHFLSGQWSCKVSEGSSNGLSQVVRYSFSPDGLWMTEISHDAGAPEKDWSTQIWGYDAQAKKLVAVSFTGYGIFTKSVDGWFAGEFTSRRDDNGATVSLKRVNDQSMQWTIRSSDGSSVVYEICSQDGGG
jgi:hypothetical protein